MSWWTHWAWYEPGMGGLRVTAVIPGGPTDQAGLRRDDTILTINQVPLRSPAELFYFLRSGRGQAMLQVRKGNSGIVAPLTVPLAW